MTKFTILAAVAVFTLGTVVGRTTAPTPAQASETKMSISIDELTRKAGPLSAESFDAV